MPAGRPKRDPIVIEQPVADAQAVRTDLVTLDQLTEHRRNAIATVSEEFGVTLPDFDIEVYFRNVNFLDQQAAEIIMQQGVWLIALKEALPHGDFQKELVKRTQISPRRAAVYMQATRRLSTDGGKKFLANASQAAHLSRTRLIEMAVGMTEDDLATLADDGELDGVTREEYLGMSRTALLATLKRRDTELDQGATQLEAAEGKLKKLSKAKKHLPADDPDEALVREFEVVTTEHSGEAAKLMTKDVIDAMHAIDGADWQEADAEHAEALNQRVRTAKLNALIKVVAACKEAALATGIDPADIGVAADDFMPANFGN